MMLSPVLISLNTVAPDMLILVSVEWVNHCTIKSSPYNLMHNHLPSGKLCSVLCNTHLHNEKFYLVLVSDVSQATHTFG